MRPGNRDVPYAHLPGAARLRFALAYAAPEDVLPQARELWALARAADGGSKAERGAAADRLRALVAAHEAGERFNPGWLEGDERVVVELPASRVTPLCVQPGRAVLTHRHIYFQPFNVTSSAPVQAHALRGATAAERRRFQLEDAGLEVFSGARASLFLAFRAPAARDAFAAALAAQPAARLEPARRDAAWTRDWAAGWVSNYDYLMHLNRAAGRSFNDLTQYPVFPWVLADYSSPALDLADPAAFRDLSRPVAALSPGRARHGRDTFAALSGAGLPDPPWMHGSHYSNPGVVVHFLVRANPQLMLRLQAGRFDAPDRLFCGVAQAWAGVTSQDSDVKELIPQLYSPAEAPALLANGAGAALGVRAGGRPVGDVDLPPWAAGPEDFARKMAAALESPHVSARLHRWIDLVFGVASRGRAAERADNVFHYMTYDEVAAGYLARESDPVLLDAYRAQVREYGRTPRQLFARRHPRRRAPAALRRALAGCVCGAPPPTPPPRAPRPATPRAGLGWGVAARGGTPALRAAAKLAAPKAATREAALAWLEAAAAIKEPSELVLGPGGTSVLEAVAAWVRPGGGAEAEADDRGRLSALVRAAAALAVAPLNRRAMVDAGVLELLARAAVGQHASPSELDLAATALRVAAALAAEGGGHVAALDGALLVRAADVVAGWQPGQGIEGLASAALLITSLCQFASKRRFFAERGLLRDLLRCIASLAPPPPAEGANGAAANAAANAAGGGGGGSVQSSQSSPTHSRYGGDPGGGGGASPAPSFARRRSSAADLQRAAARRQAALALASLLQDDAQKEELLVSDAGFSAVLALCAAEREPSSVAAAGWECVAALSAARAARRRLAAPEVVSGMLRAARGGGVAVQRPVAACLANLAADGGLPPEAPPPLPGEGLAAAALLLGGSPDPEVQRHAAAALWHLMQLPRAREALVEAGALRVLLAVGSNRRAVRAARLAVQALRPCAEDAALRPRLEAAAAEAGVDLERLFKEGGAARSLSHAHPEPAGVPLAPQILS
jgi:hypothetical protein